MPFSEESTSRLMRLRIKGNLFSRRLGRGRDAGRPAPPAQIRT